MSAASANVSAKFSVRLEPETVAETPASDAPTPTVAALVSSSSAICSVVPRGRAFAHHDRGDLRQARVACGIEIAARSGNQELEGHLRGAPILEHHHVQSVRQIDFGGPRQFDLENLGRDGRAALDDHGLGGVCACWPRAWSVTAGTDRDADGQNDSVCVALP